MHSSKRVETSTLVITLEADGIITWRYRPAVREETGDDARQNVEATLELCSGEPALVLLHLDARVLLTAAARCTYAESSPPVFASLAMVARNPAEEMIASFMLTNVRATTGARVFAEESTARSWLSSSAQVRHGER